MAVGLGAQVAPSPLPRLFEMGFAEQLQEIIGRLPGGHQTVLFSATLPKLLVEFARAGEWQGWLWTPARPVCPGPW